MSDCNQPTKDRKTPVHHVILLGGSFQQLSVAFIDYSPGKKEGKYRISPPVNRVIAYVRTGMSHHVGLKFMFLC